MGRDSCPFYLTISFIRKGSVELDDLLNLIANVGFPIAVAAYLLIRIENKLGDLTRAIADSGMHHYSAGSGLHGKQPQYVCIR